MDRVDGARDGLADGGVARPHVLGADHKTTLDFQWGYSRAFTRDKDVSADQLAEVATTLEKTLEISQRVCGREHPRTCSIRGELTFAREEIARRRGA